MAQPEYWIWLYRTLGNCVLASDLVIFYGSAQAVYEAGRSDWLRSGIVEPEEADRLAKFSPSQSYGIIETCEKNNWRIITPDSEFYPELLRKIRDFPMVLFADGKIEFLRKTPKIAIVGARDASDKARVAAYRLGIYLSSTDAVTVSGAALGTDSCAHEGALLSHGGTVAVLGCGLGCNYLVKAQGLRERIKQNGCIVSEFLPYSEPSRFTFPKRNRIISGMSLATVVAEASLRSGSLITAKRAVEQNRELYVMAPDVVSSPGCDKLIALGAKTVRCAMDIMQEYYFELPDGRFDEYYLYSPLKNDGIKGRSILKPESLSAEEYRNYYSTAQSHTQANNNDYSVHPEKRKPEEHNNISAENRAADNKTDGGSDFHGNAIQEQNAYTAQTVPREYDLSGLSEEAKTVFSVLGSTPELSDGLQAKTGLSPADIMCAVTELELSDLAQTHPGNLISRL